MNSYENNACNRKELMLMNPIAIYTLSSELHNKRTEQQEPSPLSRERTGDGSRHSQSAGATVSNDFLTSLHIDYDLRGSDFTDYGTHTLDMIYVCTGGTEGIFLQLLPQLLAHSQHQSLANTLPEERHNPFYLLTSGKNNSLAASMEILSYLRQHGYKGEIIHGNSEYINHRVNILYKAAEARQKLHGLRLGVIGQPSDWLISSHADRDKVRQRLGIELVDIGMQELIAASTCENDGDSLSGAMKIYEALKDIVERHHLQGFTLRCFDLLTTVHNTGCMALARLTADQGLTTMGIVAGCEGDVPALLSMAIVKALTGVSGFQANPSSIDPETGTIVFAHCTIPLNMVERYELDTHFESGIGVGIRGYMKPGPVTIFKVSGDLQRCFIAEGDLVRNEAKPDLCRTQQVIRLADPSQASYFLTNPIGNHHIIFPGHYKALLEEI